MANPKRVARRAAKPAPVPATDDQEPAAEEPPVPTEQPCRFAFTLSIGYQADAVPGEDALDAEWAALEYDIQDLLSGRGGVVIRVNGRMQPMPTPKVERGWECELCAGKGGDEFGFPCVECKGTGRVMGENAEEPERPKSFPAVEQ